jgi:hypothetical protein
MLVADGKIMMSTAEAREFAEATFAPWTPRTVAEFNAMCELGSARHLVDNTEGAGFMHALAAEGMRFGENGEVNFPINKQKAAYMKVHGVWPTDQQVQSAPTSAATNLRMVPSKAGGS